MSALLRRLRRAVTEGRGALTTIASLLPLDPARAQSLLPAGLSLAPDRPARALLLLSRCHFSAWMGDMRYLEMILGIADVAAPAAAPGLYFRRLYLDAALPRILGNLVYGWEKLPARLVWEGEGQDGTIAAASTWRITSAAGAPILTASWRDVTDDDPVPAPADPSALFAALAQPVLSQAARRRSSDAARTCGGPFLRTRIDTRTPAALRRLVGDVHLGPALDPPELAGVTWPATPAFLFHTTQVVGLPAPIRGR